MLGELATEPVDIDAHRRVEHPVEIMRLVEDVLCDLDFARNATVERAFDEEIEEPDQRFGPPEITAIANALGFCGQALPIVCIRPRHSAWLSVFVGRASANIPNAARPTVS
ncbi:hypothetical protein QP179_04280 [Sphingomonas aurantiaca]|uniref:hypothetical protein n=1 Tax=Sphingomonas aurantiaca TaxID=185949 RepID=UPI002FDF2408